uniref:F-box family protein n=1 Tax=Solanum tuberosum TaxID=4113 RepID=M1C0X1_SOLTU
MSEKGRPLPKFGEWDVNDPASAEGFTVIFNKARDEKKTGGKPDSPSKADGNRKEGEEPLKPQTDMKIYVPEEIIVEILIRLPVQSLLRFKCVSKSWKILVTSDYLKTKHCNHAKNNKKFLVARKVDSISYYCSSLSSAQPLQKLSRCPSTYVILCCCDGLVLLFGDGYLLWNPSTNESIQLPNLELRQGTHREALHSTYGLGYDSVSNDYKILKIDNNEGDGDDLRSRNKILALKSGSWRKIDKHPRIFGSSVLHRQFSTHMRREDSLAFICGSFHWIGKDNLNKYFMVLFNISNEVYGEMSLPDGICNISNMVYITRGVSVIEGMLYAYSTCINAEGSTFKLWVMKEYGVKESWTGLFTIQERDIYLNIMPKYMFADGEMLFMYVNNVFSHGFRTSKGPFELFPSYARFLQGFVYSESLISPKLLV